MKTALRLTIAAFGLAVFNISAQTPAELGIQTYAGLTITGTAGTVYSIEYVTDLAQTNTASAWRSLEYLQLPASSYLQADKSAPATGKQFYRAVAMEPPASMVFIPPGTFRMGSTTNEVDRDESEGPQTAVIINRGFWMGKYEVTQGEYLTVMGNNPSWHNGDRTPEGARNFGVDLNRPVESVSWFDATDYCALRTQRERTAGRIATNAAYRLPTEAGRRYESALDLAEDLEHWAAGEPIRARRVGLPERAWLWCRRRPALAGLAGTSVAVLLAVSALSLWRVRSARYQEDLERYAANISLADSAVRAGSMDRALDYLMRCPAEQRHWEWGRLLFECMQEVSSIPAHTNRPQFLVRSLINGIAFDSQGSRIGTRGLDGTLAVWDPIEGRELFRVGDSTNEVTSFSFRPRQTQIAVGRLDGSLDLLDSGSGQLVLRLIAAHVGLTNPPSDPVVGISIDVYDTGPIRDPLPRRPWAVTGMAWDPKGERMAVVRADGGVIVREAEADGKAWEWSPPGSGSTVKTWFTQAGSSVVVQSAGLAQRFDPLTGRELDALRWDPVGVAPRGATVSPGGDRVVLISARWQATLRDARGVVADLGTLLLQSKNSPLAAFFSRDGSHFCIGGGAGAARVFRTDTGEVSFALPYAVYGGAFSADGDRLAVYGAERVVHLWDVHHRVEVGPLRGHLSSVTDITYDPNGRLIATASREGVVKIWSAPLSGQVLFGDTLTTSSGYSPDGRWLATGPAWRGVQLWDARTGRRQWSVPSRTHTVNTMAFSPDSRLLYTAGSDRCVRIYQVADGRPAGMLRGHERAAFAVDCSPNGQCVATGDLGGTVRIWDARTRQEKHSLPAHPAAVWSVFFDPKSRFLVTAGSGRPRVWDVNTGNLIVELDDRVAGAYFAAFSPDGRHVLAACLDRRIRVWEIPSGRVVKEWTSQTQGVSYVSHTPDGLRFAVAVADMSTAGFSVPRVEIWDAEQGRALLNMEAHRDSIYTASFDASGRRLATASMDTTVRQWETFPWRDAEYPEPKGGTPGDRIRHFARQCWRERVAQTPHGSKEVRMSEEPPLPPGVPEWEQDRWPRRDPKAGPLQIDLDRYYTGVLDACFFPNWSEGEFDDDLSDVPTGLQRLAGVSFDIRGVVWLRWAPPFPADAAFRASCHDFPERVDGIAIGRKFRRLHVLHAATTYNAGDTKFLKGPGGKPLAVAAYVLHYADGTRHEHEVVYGRDLRNWWWGGRGDSEAAVERATVAWTGSNAVTERYEAKLRLFLSTFENPRPDVEVVGVDFVSKLTPAAPFLVAITVEP